LQALAAEKERALETAFPLLQQAGDGNGNAPADTSAAASGKAGAATLETLLGGGDQE
jgi:hypothetical protein